MGKAYIISTGPVDEELLTIKAVKVLEKCTAVLYDRIVSNNILNYFLSRLFSLRSILLPVHLTILNIFYFMF